MGELPALFLYEPLPDVLPQVSERTGVAMWEMNGGRITTFGSGFIAQGQCGGGGGVRPVGGCGQSYQGDYAEPGTSVEPGGRADG